MKGGERIKLGRVLMKVIEVNSDYEDENNEEDIEASDSNHTQMTLGELNVELDGVGSREVNLDAPN